MKPQEIEKLLKKNINKLHSIIQDYIPLFNQDSDLIENMKTKYNINEGLLSSIKQKAEDVDNQVKALNESTNSSFFKEMRGFLLNDFGVMLDLLRMLFFQIVFYTKKENIIDLISSSDDTTFNIVAGNYLLLKTNYKIMKNALNQMFFKDIKLGDELVVDENTDLWDVKNMEHEVFHSDFYKIREYAAKLASSLQNKIDDNAFTLLQQQISELLKNAIKHGNKNELNKLVKVWYRFENDYFKIIVEDEGEGFKELEKWNQFNKKRNQAIINQDLDQIMKYNIFRTDHSDEDDGGNALFAALEYWDSGLIFNLKRNKVLAVKYFF